MVEELFVFNVSLWGKLWDRRITDYLINIKDPVPPVTLWSPRKICSAFAVAGPPHRQAVAVFASWRSCWSKRMLEINLTVIHACFNQSIFVHSVSQRLVSSIHHKSHCSYENGYQSNEGGSVWSRPNHARLWVSVDVFKPSSHSRNEYFGQDRGVNGSRLKVKWSILSLKWCIKTFVIISEPNIFYWIFNCLKACIKSLFLDPADVDAALCSPGFRMVVTLAIG